MVQENRIIRAIGLIRDIGIIIGVPVLIIVGIRLYEVKISALESQIEYLKQTQYPQALQTIEAHEKLYMAFHPCT